MERKITVFLGADSINLSDAYVDVDNYGFDREKINFTDPESGMPTFPITDVTETESGLPNFGLDISSTLTAPTIYNNNFFRNKMRIYFSEWDWNLIISSPQKKAFIDAISQEFDLMAQKTQDLYKSIDIDNTSDEIVPYLSYLLGHQIEDFSLSSFNIRELTKNLINIYSIKGTDLAYEKFFNSLGFDISIEDLWWEGADDILAKLNQGLVFLKTYDELSSSSKTEITRRVRAGDVPYFNNTQQKTQILNEHIGFWTSGLTHYSSTLVNSYINPDSFTIKVGHIVLIDDGQENIVDSNNNKVGTINYLTGQYDFSFNFMPQSGDLLSGYEPGNTLDVFADYYKIVSGDFYKLNKSNFLRLQLQNKTTQTISNDPDHLFPTSETIQFINNGIYNGFLLKRLVAWQTLIISDGVDSVYEDGNGNLRDSVTKTKVGTIDRINAHYTFTFNFFNGLSGIESGNFIPTITATYKYDNTNVLTDIDSLVNSESFSAASLAISLSYIKFLTPVHVNQSSILSFLVPFVEKLTNAFTDLYWSIIGINVETSYTTKTLIIDEGTMESGHFIYLGNVGCNNLFLGSVFLLVGDQIIQDNQHGEFFVPSLNATIGSINYLTGDYNIYGLSSLDLSGLVSFKIKFSCADLYNENNAVLQDVTYGKAKQKMRGYSNTYPLKYDRNYNFPIDDKLKFLWRIQESGFDSGSISGELYESGTDRYTEETQKEHKFYIFSKTIWQRGQIFSDNIPQHFKYNNKFNYTDNFSDTSIPINNFFKYDLFHNEKSIDTISSKITSMMFDSFWGYPVISHSEAFNPEDLDYLWQQNFSSGGFDDLSGVSGLEPFEQWENGLNFDFFREQTIIALGYQPFEQIYPFRFSPDFIPFPKPITFNMDNDYWKFGENKFVLESGGSGYIEEYIEYSGFDERINESGDVPFVFNWAGGIELSFNSYNASDTNKFLNEYGNPTYFAGNPPFGNMYPTIVDFLIKTMLAGQESGGMDNISIEEIPFNLPLDLFFESGIIHPISFSDALGFMYFLPFPEQDMFTPVDNGNFIRVINFDFFREYRTHGQGMGDRSNPVFESGSPNIPTRHSYYWDELAYDIPFMIQGQIGHKINESGYIVERKTMNKWISPPINLFSNIDMLFVEDNFEVNKFFT